MRTSSWSKNVGANLFWKLLLVFGELIFIVLLLQHPTMIWQVWVAFPLKGASTALDLIEHVQTLSGSRVNTFSTLCKSRFDSLWRYQPGAECRACRLRRPPTDCQTNQKNRNEQMRFAGSTSSNANWTWNSKSTIKSDAICHSAENNALQNGCPILLCHGGTWCNNCTKCH